MTDLRKAHAEHGSTSLRLAAEMALEALETLWDILDDIDTASDMAKENDAWYRKRVEALQKKRWDTMITTDGYKLKGGPVEALRQALAQEVTGEVTGDVDLAKVGEVGVWGNSQALEEPANSTTDFVEPVAWIEKDKDYLAVSADPFENAIPVYTAPPKREWVGLTDEERHDVLEDATGDGGHVYYDTLFRTIEAKLKEKNAKGRKN